MPDALWKDVLSQLEGQFSRPNFVTWLKPTDLVREGEGLLSVAAPNDYAKSWIEKNALARIRELLSPHFPSIENLRVVVVPKGGETKTDLPLLQVSEPSVSTEPADPQPTSAVTTPIKAKQFNPNYTFETFIVGNNNRLAFAASQVVAEKPGTAYNPLFIYGGVGLGKTHLMQAIANELLHQDPSKKIAYVSCETFTGEFIQALQNKSIDEFKRKYRSVDMLLIDDIQFLANKEGTQEEFFHTFNILHQANRQIVITSDRVPKEIPNLEERLSSRFGWGMIADVQSPNFETRVAILQEKAKEKSLVIPTEVVEYIANTITSNVRELEGSLTKLSTAAMIEQASITVEFAEEILKDLTQAKAASVSTKKVLKVVCDYFSLELADILGTKRVKELVYPRQLTMYLLREKLHQSYPQVAESLGGRDHTTVMHAVKKISQLIKQDAKIERDLNKIIQSLYA